MSSSDVNVLSKIKKFDISSIAKPGKAERAFLIVGRKGSGKTTLMKWILYNIREEVNFAVAMTPTVDTLRDFQSFLPKHAVHREYKESVIKNLMDFITDVQIKNPDKDQFGVVGILTDDCLFDKKVLKSETMREVHMNGRHPRIMIMNLVQYVMDVPPDIRNNTDYIFAMYDNVQTNREKLHRAFFGVMSYNEFEQTFSQIIKIHPRACMVIDNTNGGQSIEKSVYWYVAEPLEKRFCLGSREFWKLGHLAEQGKIEHPLLKAHEALDTVQSKRKRGAASIMVVNDQGNDDAGTSASKRSRRK
jgi:hypothetical protein